MKEGWHEMTNEEYHKEKGLSSSGIIQLLKSPAHYAAREEFKKTDAMIQGSALHCLTLEPDSFNDRFIVMKKGEVRTATKKAKDNSKSLLTSGQYKEALKWAQEIVSNPYAEKLLHALGPVEQSGFWQDEETGVLLKVRPDKKIQELKTVVDVKTWSLAKHYSLDYDWLWSKEISNRKYHIQATHYLNGCSILDEIEYENFVWIVIVKEPPYQVLTYELTEIDKKDAQDEIESALWEYKECMEKDIWPKPSFPGIRQAGRYQWQNR